jgi:hypothetical protein
MAITPNKLQGYDKPVKICVGFLYNFALDVIGEIFLKSSIVKKIENEMTG